MINFFCGSVPIGRAIRDLTTRLGFLQNPFSLRSISSKPSINQNPFVVSYLVSSCGLSPAAAISASKKVSFGSSERTDSVISLFRNHGFSEAQISSLISRCPSLLVAKPTKNLLPKLQFFLSFGISNPDIAKILSKDPRVLCSSLENKIIPAFNFLKSLVGSVENVVIGLKRQPRIINHLQNVARNMEIMRENGVPESNIVSLQINYPSTMTINNDRFKKIVEDIQQMGFSPSKYLFVIALHVLTSMNRTTWKQKLEAYQRSGFSENEIRIAFRRYPWFMMLSEKNIMSHMDLLVKKMGWEREVIIRYPQLLAFSLENMILPRCSVLRVLILKGLVREDLKIGRLMIRSEKYFVENFVTKYEKEVPHLLDLYKRKNISLLEVEDGTEEVG